jgi:hypothetical protein
MGWYDLVLEEARKNNVVFEGRGRGERVSEGKEERA